MPTWYVSSVESGEASPYDVDFERLAEFIGLPLKMVDACKVAKPVRGKAEAEVVLQEPIGNVVDLQKYREGKWQLTSSSEKD